MLRLTNYMKCSRLTSDFGKRYCTIHSIKLTNSSIYPSIASSVNSSRLKVTGSLHPIPSRIGISTRFASISSMKSISHENEKTSRHESLSISVLNQLPERTVFESGVNTWDLLKEEVKKQEKLVIVLDDDPTGCQTVHDVDILLDYSVESLVDQLEKKDARIFYVLTNTRSLPEVQVVTVVNKLIENISIAIEKTKCSLPILFISRCDSTLRGHFPLETDLISKSIDKLLASASARMSHVDVVAFIPAFFDGGRLTMNDIHYVVEGNNMVPAGMTPFAKDAHFGYKSSNLIEFVREKVHDVDNIVSISLDDIREGGPHKVAEILLGIPRESKSVVIVNAVNQDDLNTFTLGALQVEKEVNILYRSAASFVASRAAIKPRQLIQGINITDPSIKSGGLIVVGSYVPKTTEQFNHLLENTDIESVVISVPHIINAHRDNASEIQSQRKEDFKDYYVISIASQIDDILMKGRNVVLSTSREFYAGATLADTKVVSDTLINILKSLKAVPRFIVSKGGITSQDVASNGYDCKKAYVIGQIEPGVPIWLLHSSSSDYDYKSIREDNVPYLNSDGFIISNVTSGDKKSDRAIPYVVFPGNVGNSSSLTRVAMKLGVQGREPGSSRASSFNTLYDVSVAYASTPDRNDSSKKMNHNLLNTLRKYKREGKAIPAFNIYNLEGAKACIEAGKKMQSPIILQVHSAPLKFGGIPFLDMLYSYRSAGIPSKSDPSAIIPVFIQMDHITSDSDIEMILSWGKADAIMIDGSEKPFMENVAWTKKMTQLAHLQGLIVEGELGKIAGKEDGLSVGELEAKMTDPKQAEFFYKETKIDSLAVTIGNVHGDYSRPPKLDFQRLENIQRLTPEDLPLVLHGASGLPRELLVGSMNRGVCKFNVNTDLRHASMTAMKDSLSLKEADVLDVMKATTDAMTAVAIEKIRLFNRDEGP